MQEFPWIPSEKQRFGRPGTEYDFAGRDAAKAFEEYNIAEKQAKELGKDVNRRVSALVVSIIDSCPAHPEPPKPSPLSVPLHHGLLII